MKDVSSIQTQKIIEHEINKKQKEYIEKLDKFIHKFSNKGKNSCLYFEGLNGSQKTTTAFYIIKELYKKYFKGYYFMYVATMDILVRHLGVFENQRTEENIIFLELSRRNYKVYVGKIGNKEIDFIAVLNDKKIYVQVAYKMHEQSTIEREFGSLMAIKDNYPKYVVTMDPLWSDTIEGIKHVYIADFLLMKEY
jgi:predicted AAA+ superfamily ATPase